MNTRSMSLAKWMMAAALLVTLVLGASAGWVMAQEGLVYRQYILGENDLLFLDRVGQALEDGGQKPILIVPSKIRPCPGLNKEVWQCVVEAKLLARIEEP